MSDQLGYPEGTLHERSVTPHISLEIRSAAMRVVKTGTKGGPYDDFSVSRGIGDFELPMFHRRGWFFRPEASSLSRVRDGTISLGEREVRTRV